MAGGGSQKKTINWSLLLQALGTGFTLLAVVVGSLMAYAYMNGGTAARLDNHERRLDALEAAERRGGRQ